MGMLNLTDEGKRFIDQWNDDNDFITAHTSGSTGVPKEIKLRKADMICSAKATNLRFGITSESRLVCPLSAGYIAGKMMIVRALLADCELVMEPPSNNPFVKDYGRTDLVAVVPSQCRALMQNRNAIRSISNLIIGGAPVSKALEQELLCKSWKAFATYGMTETCSHVALRELGSDVYTAMPGITFQTDDRKCLVINAPDYSFKRLVTNDIVELQSDDSFCWLGRFDNVINSGGIKFHPEQLEKKLEGIIPYPFFFRSMPDEKWGQAIEMVVECQQSHSTEAVIACTMACKRNLVKEAFPKRITIVPELPRTSNGKLKR